jgi:hypothetical protein
MENECSNEQIKNAFDVLCMNHTIKTWPLLDDNLEKRTINVEFIKESDEQNIDFEKEIVLRVVNDNIQPYIDNRIKFLSQEEINNNARSDIKVSFDYSKPNSSELGTDSLNVQGSSLNLNGSSFRLTGEKIIILQFMKALGYDTCTTIKYNLNVGRTPCETNKLFNESILFSSFNTGINTLSENDKEFLQKTYNIKEEEDPKEDENKYIKRDPKEDPKEDENKYIKRDSKQDDNSVKTLIIVFSVLGGIVLIGGLISLYEYRKRDKD